MARCANMQYAYGLLNLSYSQVPSPGLPLVCEISLKTAEGDSLVLELWRLAVVAGGDPSVKVG